MTLIARRSPITGKLNTMEIPVTTEQYKAWQGGTLIQVAMPDLTPAQREFLQTGFTPQDWDSMKPDQDYEGPVTTAGSFIVDEDKCRMPDTICRNHGCHDTGRGVCAECGRFLDEE